MKSAILAAGLVASLALASPALAFERSGNIDIHTARGDVTNSFSRRFDAKDGTFSRSGRLVLQGGRTVTYALSGTCRPAASSCDFTGNAVGPAGGKWLAQGTLSRNPQGVRLVGNLTTPRGRSIDFDRELGGRRQYRDHGATE
jgi:hypothetical protein